MDFKVSDWVRIKTPIFEYDGTDRIAEGIKKLSIKDMWIFDENHFKMEPDKYIEHWEPKEGEWCWSKYDGLVRIIKKEEFANSYIVEPIALTIQRQSYGITGLEPFIGKLPSFLKEQ